MAAAGAAVATLSCACSLCPLKSTGLRSFTPQGLATVKGGGLRIRCAAEGFGGGGGVGGDFRVARVSDGSKLQSGFSGGATNVMLPPAPLQEDGLQVQLGFEDGGAASSGSNSINSRERMRRERIAHANRGRVPWNKGRCHTPETIAKIKERTKLAMLNPQIRDKLRLCGKNQSKETKAKIREKMVGFWEMQRTIKEAQVRCVRNWKEMIAEAARVGDPGDEEYEWDSYKILKMQCRLEALEEERRKKEALKVRVKVERERKPVTDAHRKAISEAIKAKWADPTYQARVSAGIARDRKPREKQRVRVLGSPKKKVAIPKSSRKVANAREIQVGKKKPLQVLPVDENFIAEVLAEEVTLKTRSERSSAARINGPRKVTLVSLEDNNLSSKDVTETASEDKSAEHEEMALLEGRKTFEDTDVKTPSLRPEGVQLSSKLTAHSHKDPFVLEKIQRIQQLRKGRLEVELKRKEAADRARVLIADAERVASALEQAGSIDAATMAKLIETRKLLAEAARSVQAAEMKQGNSLGKSKNLGTQENEKPLSLSTSGDFHSRMWTSGDNIADCPHPIPIRIGSMRSKEEHQLHLNQLGGNLSSSSRSSRWATSGSDLVEESQSSMASGTEQSPSGSTEGFQSSKEGINGLAGRGSSNPRNRNKPVWHGGRFSVNDEDERT